MNSYESFKKGFLISIAKPGVKDEQSFKTWKLANEYGIPEAHVRELLLRWASELLIMIQAYDGAQVRPWNQWLSEDALFFNETDNGYVRIKLLAAGAALVEDLPARSIGFANVS
jgi:hypothetical protein